VLTGAAVLVAAAVFVFFRGPKAAHEHVAVPAEDQPADGEAAVTRQS
jgi:hypothetical protein